MDGLAYWLEGTAISRFMNWSWWAWPVAESLHFVGLALLLGTVGLFDLRLMGFAKDLQPELLHRLVPFGIAGFCLNATTGALFFTGIPHLYLGNPAFWAKIGLLAAAGINLLAFWLFVGDEINNIRPGQSAPLLARWLGAISLSIWISVLVAGRLIAFYKP